MNDYKARFKKLSSTEQEKVTRIVEAIAVNKVANNSDYKLSTDAKDLVIDIIKDKILEM